MNLTAHPHRRVDRIEGPRRDIVLPPPGNHVRVRDRAAPPSGTAARKGDGQPRVQQSSADRAWEAAQQTRHGELDILFRPIRSFVCTGWPGL